MNKEFIKEFEEIYSYLYRIEKEYLASRIDFRYFTMKIIKDLLNRVEQLESKTETLK